MKAAYWLRLWRTSSDEVLAGLAAQQPGDPGQPAEAEQAEQGGGREEAEARDRPEEVEPAARPTKYARFGLDPVMLYAKSIRKMTQTMLSYSVSRSRSAAVIGRSSRAMIASEKIVRTRMKMS